MTPSSALLSEVRRIMASARITPVKLAYRMRWPLSATNALLSNKHPITLDHVAVLSRALKRPVFLQFYPDQPPSAHIP